MVCVGITEQAKKSDPRRLSVVAGSKFPGVSEFSGVSVVSVFSRLMTVGVVIDGRPAIQQATSCIGMTEGVRDSILSSSVVRGRMKRRKEGRKEGKKQ